MKIIEDTNQLKDFYEENRLELNELCKSLTGSMASPVRLRNEAYFLVQDFGFQKGYALSNCQKYRLVELMLFGEGTDNGEECN